MVRRAVVLVGVLLGVLVAPSAATAAPPVATADFACTGSEQSWDVPAGVTTVDVVAIGARGGTGSTAGKVPGAPVRCAPGWSLVVPGQRLWVDVGCDGASPERPGSMAGGPEPAPPVLAVVAVGRRTCGRCPGSRAGRSHRA